MTNQSKEMSVRFRREAVRISRSPTNGLALLGLRSLGPSPADLRLRYLTLDPKRRQPCAWQPKPSFEEEVARLPAREELRVEAVEALDLEERVAQREQPSQNTLRVTSWSMDELCERREVQRHLADASLAEEQDRPNDEELHQAVRRVPLAPHERKRHRGPPVTGNEVQEPARVAVPIARDHHDGVTLVLPAQGVQRHGEPALGPAAAPVARDAFELGRRRFVE